MGKMLWLLCLRPEGFQDVFAQLYKGDADPMVKCMQTDYAQHIVRNDLFQLDWHAEGPLCWHVFVSLFETGSNVSLYSLFYVLALILWVSQRGSICYLVFMRRCLSFEFVFMCVSWFFMLLAGTALWKLQSQERINIICHPRKKYLSMLCSMYFYLEGLHTRWLFHWNGGCWDH